MLGLVSDCIECILVLSTVIVYSFFFFILGLQSLLRNLAIIFTDPRIRILEVALFRVVILILGSEFVDFCL